MIVANRLLIVDDESGITRIIETVAHALGYEVLSINDSEQFEKALGRLEPTIICLDIAMPGRDGVELIATLASRSYPGQVVVMSGSHPSYIQMSSAIAKVRGLNIAGTLPKPFRAAEVSALLTRLMIKS